MLNGSRVFLAALATCSSLLFPQAAISLSPEAIWNQFSQAMSLEQADFTWKKTYPDTLENGMSVTVTGFIVPVEAQAYFHTFLMVNDPQDCPFCGNGEGYGPVLEVKLKRPIAETTEFALITVEGRLEFVGDKYTSQLFRLLDARVLK